MKDYYYILGLTRDADEQEIRQAFKKLSLKFHPDRNEGDKFFEDHFKEVQEAYEILGDPDRRAKYDAQLEAKQSPAAPPAAVDTARPLIQIFTISRKVIGAQEPVTITWETAHADDIWIDVLGKVERTGTKTLRLSGLQHRPQISITITARNTHINQAVEQTLVVQNKDLRGQTPAPQEVQAPKPKAALGDGSKKQTPIATPPPRAYRYDDEEEEKQAPAAKSPITSKDVYTYLIIAMLVVLGIALTVIVIRLQYAAN